MQQLAPYNLDYFGLNAMPSGLTLCFDPNAVVSGTEEIPNMLTKACLVSIANKVVKWSRKIFDCDFALKEADSNWQLWVLDGFQDKEMAESTPIKLTEKGMAQYLRENVSKKTIYRYQ